MNPAFYSFTVTIKSPKHITIYIYSELLPFSQIYPIIHYTHLIKSLWKSWIQHKITILVKSQICRADGQLPLIQAEAEWVVPGSARQCRQNHWKIWEIQQTYGDLMVVKWWWFDLPSGKLLHNYGKIHHFWWETPLFQWPFSIAMLNYQRVMVVKWWWFNGI